MDNKTFETNQLVLIDSDLANTSIALVCSQTSNKLYTEVISLCGTHTWTVMTYRVSDIQNNILLFRNTDNEIMYALLIVDGIYHFSHDIRNNYANEMDIFISKNTLLDNVITNSTYNTSLELIKHNLMNVELIKSPNMSIHIGHITQIHIDLNVPKKMIEVYCTDKAKASLLKDLKGNGIPYKLKGNKFILEDTPKSATAIRLVRDRIGLQCVKITEL